MRARSPRSIIASSSSSGRSPLRLVRKSCRKTPLASKCSWAKSKDYTMASLTKKERDALPDSDFAVPGKRKLPINDARHVKLAWDMVDRTEGLSEAEKKTARQRILRKAKSLDVDTSGWDKMKAAAEMIELIAAVEYEAAEDVIDDEIDEALKSGVIEALQPVRAEGMSIEAMSLNISNSGH